MSADGLSCLHAKSLLAGCLYSKRLDSGNAVKSHAQLPDVAAFAHSNVSWNYVVGSGR